MPVSFDMADYVYRVTPPRRGGFMAEAKRAAEPFEAASILYEPIQHTVWFAFGETAEAALAAVKTQVLSQCPVNAHSVVQP